VAERQSTRNWRSGGLAVLSATCIILIPVAVDGARAAPKFSTKTVYYTVPGSTPKEMLAYMRRNGPHGNSGRPPSTSSAHITQTMRLSPTSSGCRINKRKLTVKMTLHLPRLAAGQKLSAAVRSTWNNFTAYAKQHENHHKSLYIACARRIDQRVRAVSNKQSCQAIRTRIKAIFAEENRLCERSNQAFDRLETERVANLPFFRQANSAPQFTSKRSIRRHGTTKIIRLER